MQKEHTETYKGRAVEIRVVGSGPSERLTVHVNRLDVSDRVTVRPDDMAGAIESVHRQIDAGAL